MLKNILKLLIIGLILPSFNIDNVYAEYAGISTRCLVKNQAQDYMYAGFQINGAAKTITLGAYAVSQIPGNNFLPRLEVKTYPDAKSIYVDSNSGLKSSIATNLTLAEGWYTITVSPVNQAGIGIVYIREFDDHTISQATLASISTRCHVGSVAEDAMIAGIELKQSAQSAQSEQCSEIRGLGFSNSEIAGNNFLPNLRLQTFPDGIIFKEVTDVYKDANLDLKPLILSNKLLSSGNYTTMVTPVKNSGIGLVAITAKNKDACLSETFQCDGREYCSQMNSCEEALFFLQNCPNPKMDGDGDGIPCEAQWCGHLVKNF